MAELTRRNMIAGSALAVAGLAAAGIAAKPALAASERVGESGFNAGWGDTEVDQEVLDTPFGELVDSWFNYSWSYTAEFEPQPERDHVLVITSSAAIGGNGDHIAQTVVDEIGDAADVEVIHLRDYSITPFMTLNGTLPVDQVDGQKDGMVPILEALHRANVVIGIAPTYYNNIDSRMMLMLTRLWAMAWKNPDYVWGPAKRTAVMLTCTGTNPNYLKKWTTA